MLSDAVVKGCLFEIQKIWWQTLESRRPWGIWISYHETISKEDDRPQTDVISAWFLSKNGIQERGAWTYIRMRLVHSGKYWSTGIFPTHSSLLSGKVHQTNEIGLASFAAIKNESLVYLDFIFGGTYGFGAFYRVESCDNITFDSRVWIA